MTTDTLGRRHRFSPPQPSGRRIFIQPADLALFEAINRHGPLPTTYLYEFTKHLRRNKNQLQHRLTEFYNGDAAGPYLTRPPQYAATAESKSQDLVYDLTPRALALVTGPRTHRIDPMLHRLMNACVAASLELGAPSYGIRYISRAEILTHPKCPADTKAAPNPLALPVGDATLIPDDLFGFEYESGFRFFAVEIDRNTESIERSSFDERYNTIAKKVGAYVRALEGDRQRTRWGLPNLSVLIATTNSTHAHHILAYIEKNAPERFHARFSVAVIPDFSAYWRVPKGLFTHLLEEPWLTPGGTRDITKA